MNDYGHWILSENVKFDENTFGFIYTIECIITKMKYIGKKQCISKIKKKPLKGKTRNRIHYKQSDWKIYTSSSNELNNDIQKYGKENFIFKIIRTCDSKWALAYFEIKEQIENDVLFKDDYYNSIINVRINKPPQKELEIFNNNKVII